MKAYLEVSVEKELPKEQGTYFIILKDGTKDSDIFYPHKKLFAFQESYVKSFLREFSLPELMEEWLIWFEDSDYIRTEDKTVYADISGPEPIYVETEKVFNEFLTQKGIL